MGKFFLYVYARYRLRRLRTKMLLLIKHKSIIPCKFVPPAFSYKEAKQIYKLYGKGRKQDV